MVTIASIFAIFYRGVDINASCNCPLLTSIHSVVKKTVRELQSQRRSDERHLPGGCVDIKKYEDAVVMPWYRDMDQRHFFYVAELCTILNPRR